MAVMVNLSLDGVLHEDAANWTYLIVYPRSGATNPYTVHNVGSGDVIGECA
jgi:hypothetical protein